MAVSCCQPTHTSHTTYQEDIEKGISSFMTSMIADMLVRGKRKGRRVYDGREMERRKERRR